MRRDPQADKLSLFALQGGPMRKKRIPETDEQRDERFAKQAQRRNEDTAAEDDSIDAMVKRSIKLHGP